MTTPKMNDVESNTITTNERRVLQKLKRRFFSVFARTKIFQNSCEDKTQRYALVYGGYSTLGSKCVSQLKMLNWWVASVDFSANLLADVNILLGTSDKKEGKVNTIITSLEAALGSDKKLEVVICTTEARTNGKDNKILLRKSEEMWTENLLMPLICAKVAAQYLKPGGVFILTGAIIAAYPCVQQKTNYGKNNVDMLMKMLLSEESGLPDKSVLIAVLPTILDTEYINHNHCLEPETGFCTPLQFLSDLIIKWARRKNLPRSGSVCQLITNNYKTQIIIY